MITISLQRILPLALCGVIVLSTPAAAQNNFIDPEGQPYTSSYYKKRPGRLNVSLFRLPEQEPGQFVLQAAGADAVNSCAEISDFSYEVGFEGPYMTVKINDYTVDLRNLTSAPHYDCDQSFKRPVAQIPLSKDDLASKGIEKIRFINGGFPEEYIVKLEEQRITLSPPDRLNPLAMRTRAGKVSNVRNPLTHWFYPEDTVILWSPDADMDQDISEGIAAFAAKEKLAPLESVYPEFKSPLVAPHFYYYVDTHKRLVNLPEVDKGAPVGNITVEKVVYGIEEDMVVADPLTVFARTPGMYD